jgi:hypothetical protein
LAEGAEALMAGLVALAETGIRRVSAQTELPVLHLVAAEGALHMAGLWLKHLLVAQLVLVVLVEVATAEYLYSQI